MAAVRHHLGCLDRIEPCGKGAQQQIVRAAVRQVRHPDGKLPFCERIGARGRLGRRMVQLESNRRLAVGDNFPVKLVHGNERAGVRVKVDKAIAGRLAGELVLEDFDGDYVVFAEAAKGVGSVDWRRFTGLLANRANGRRKLSDLVKVIYISWSQQELYFE